MDGPNLNPEQFGEYAPSSTGEFVGMKAFSPDSTGKGTIGGGGRTHRGFAVRGMLGQTQQHANAFQDDLDHFMKHYSYRAVPAGLVPQSRN